VTPESNSGEMLPGARTFDVPYIPVTFRLMIQRAFSDSSRSPLAVSSTIVGSYSNFPWNFAAFLNFRHNFFYLNKEPL
jgi:hypothetical protein